MLILFVVKCILECSYFDSLLVICYFCCFRASLPMFGFVPRSFGYFVSQVRGTLGVSKFRLYLVQCLYFEGNLVPRAFP